MKNIERTNKPFSYWETDPEKLREMRRRGIPLTNKQTAILLGISEAMVSYHFNNGLAKLRTFIEKEKPELAQAFGRPKAAA